MRPVILLPCSGLTRVESGTNSFIIQWLSLITRVHFSHEIEHSLRGKKVHVFHEIGHCLREKDGLNRLCEDKTCYIVVIGRIERAERGAK
jgi:hypothetical protein